MKLLLSILVNVFALHSAWSFVMVPYPLSCNKFYLCYQKIIYEVLCPTGTMYNSATSTCVDNATPTSCKVHNGKFETNPCLNGFFTFAPHPTNCSLYYSCSSDGYAYVFQCWNGLFYSERDQSCTSPKESECIPTVYVGPPGYPPYMPVGPIYPGGSVNPTNVQGCRDDVTFTCNQATQSGNYPLPGSANMYYMCTRTTGTSVVSSITAVCPSPLFFDRVTKACVPRDRAGCALALAQNPNPCVFNQPGRKPDPTFCSQYYTCLSDGVAYKSTCSPPLLYDTGIGDCIPGSQAHCIAGSTRK